MLLAEQVKVTLLDLNLNRLRASKLLVDLERPPRLYSWHEFKDRPNLAGLACPLKLQTDPTPIIFHEMFEIVELRGQVFRP